MSCSYSSASARQKCKKTTCLLAGNCVCNPQSSFFAGPRTLLQDLTCGSNCDAPITVEAWSGGAPGAQGATGTTVGLELCDKLVFWSESLDLSVAPGSAVVNIELTSLAGFSGISGSNVGGGSEVYKQTTGGSTLEFRTLIGGTGGIGVVQNTDDVTISNTMIGGNTGGGAEVYIGKTDNVLEHRTLLGGTGIGVIQNASTIDIANTIDGQNLKSVGFIGEIFSVKNGNILQFNGIGSSDNTIAVSNSPNALDLSINTMSENVGVIFTYMPSLPGSDVIIDRTLAFFKVGPITMCLLPNNLFLNAPPAFPLGGYNAIAIDTFPILGQAIIPPDYRPLIDQVVFVRIREGDSPTIGDETATMVITTTGFITFNPLTVQIGQFGSISAGLYSQTLFWISA